MRAESDTPYVHRSWVPPRDDNLYEIPPCPFAKGGLGGDFMLR